MMKFAQRICDETDGQYRLPAERSGRTLAGELPTAWRDRGIYSG
jgi:hypothetical protein